MGMRSLRHFLVGFYLVTALFVPSGVIAENIALHKPTTQLGTWGRYGPEKAVDGDTNQRLDDGSCAHPESYDGSVDSSLRGSPTWWSVDLADGDPSKKYIIKNITIYFRNCCPERVNNSVVMYGDNNDVSTQTECASITNVAYIQTVNCRPGVPVRYLTIKHKTDTSLGICEFIVDGYQYQVCPRGWWGQGCQTACSGCNTCNEITGTCQACPQGYWGQGCGNQCSGCSTCNADTGACQGCSAGSFGTGCTSRCWCSDTSEVCHPQTGRCTSGCRTGYWGDSCSNRVPEVQGQATVVSKTQTSITLSFTPSTEQVDSYQVEYAEYTGNSATYIGGAVVQHSNAPTLQITQTNLRAYASYQFRIVPFVMTIRGLPSSPNYAVTLGIPRIDTAPTTSSVTANSLVVQFPPSDPPAVSYRVQYRTQTTNYQDGPKIPHSDNSPEYSIRLDNLIANTEYEIKVVPLYGPQETEGYESRSVRVTTLQQARPTPSPSTRPTTTTPTTTTTTQSTTTTSLSPQSPVFIPVTDTTIASVVTDKSTEVVPPFVGPIDGEDGDSSGGSGATIAGVIIAVIIILIIAIVIFVLVRRSRRGKPVPGMARVGNYIQSIKKRRKGDDKSPEDPIGGADDKQVIIPIPEPVLQTPATSTPPTPTPSRHENIYGNATLMPAIQVVDLAKYIQTKKNQTDAFKEEFKKLPIGATAKWDVGNKQENRNKNRFLNIRAYDHSRVVLDAEENDLHSDYINADYLSGYGGVEKVYVAAQGPKKTTIDDTWRAVWQTNTNRIIMVTNVVEGGKIKCEQYWPDKGSVTYGKIKVTFVTQDNYAAYVIRVFNVELKGESRTVRQFHFTSWPDHGVPTVATELLEFRRRVKTFDKNATGPLFIHCSAGVGRTGTYIAVDYCLQQGQIEKEVNVWGITYQMRTERVNMIQTLDQYIFVYDALHEALESGDTVIQASTFRKDYAKLCKEDPETNKTLLSKQFETLEALKTPAQDGKPLVALEPDNVKKNRTQDIVPSNRFRPFLSTTIDGTTSYINAVYADGFRAKLAFLVTQMPLPHTVVDLWRLVHDHHSSTIVMLNPLDKNDKDAGVYWPEEKEQSLTFGPLEVTMTSVDTEHPHITIRDFKITNARSKRVPTVRQFQLTSWAKEDAFPEARRALLEIIEMVEKWQKQTGNGPITIHCTDGASRCGLFVSSLYSVEQLKVDQEVDVFRAVKQVRIPRPQFIQDIDQYKFVHEMVLEYMDGFGDYSNFT